MCVILLKGIELLSGKPLRSSNVREAKDLFLKVCKNLQGNTAQCGKSRFRENLGSDDGTFLQMYFVYLKKK